MENYPISEVLPLATLESLGKLFYKLGGVALNEVSLDRMIDNPDLVLG